jgi:hypothetical protein
MEAQPERTERDSTDEWVISSARSPLTVAELEGRIDVALATAHSAEEAALEIGAASLEAAEQARRAAALAERASASAVRAAESAREASVTPIRPLAALEPDASAAAAPEPAAPPAASTSAPTPLDPPRDGGAGNGAVRRAPDPFEERITAFRLRAEKVMIRLQKLEAGAPADRPSEVVRLR